MDSKTLAGLLVSLGLLLLSPRLLADVTLAKAGGWVVSTDGRINGFASYTRAQGTPVKPNDPNQPVNVAGTSLEDLTDNDNRIEAFRIRSGFVGSILGLKLQKKYSEALTLTGRFQLWSVIENNRQASERNPPDMREAYLRADVIREKASDSPCRSKTAPRRRTSRAICARPTATTSRRCTAFRPRTWRSATARAASTSSRRTRRSA